MAAVRSLRVSVKPESGSEYESDSDSERDPREPEPMEVEEGELQLEDIPIRRSLKELLPDTSRRYENKAGTFITGIDVTSKEAVEKKEKRARRFHFRAEGNQSQRNVVMDRETLRKAIPKLRLEALYLCGVDDMSTQDIFGFFKEYPPAHIEWIDDTSCNVVWLDDVTSTRALINISRMADPEVNATETDRAKETDPPAQQPRARGDHGSEEEEEDNNDDDGDDDDDDEEEGEGAGDEAVKKPAPQSVEPESLSEAERESLFRNDLRPTTKEFKGRNLLLRFATMDDKKELGAARRSRYYMKYGNPNYGGMKGILSNSWKRRYHTRRIQRDVLKTKKPLIGDSMGHTPPYTHRHSDLVNLPEEPIEEEEEEEEEEGEDMDAEDRVVEYREERERGDRDRERYRERERERGLRSSGGAASLRRQGSTSASSDSDEMDYDLELKMISTPSPKKSMKMTMYADEVESNLKTLRNSVRGDGGGGSSSSVRTRIGGGAGGGGGGGGGGGTKAAGEKVTDVRQLLEEKRQGLAQQQRRQQQPYVAPATKTDVRKRLGKRPYSPEGRRSTSPVAARGPRPGAPDGHKKTGGLWSRLGSTPMDKAPERKAESGEAAGAASSGPGAEEEDSELQKVWGAMIKEKEQQSHKMKKSRLDNLPSLQIEISRDSSNGSESDS
ncbi:hypothetical protein AAFF_G00376270 [Aldrovandia affinis]|uniref:Nuclear cap-binding protein subunit 3 n=1 Tax=Aldrovandia affinis TaxID=143900 RepID=A0AAD7SFK2_9TELE|nr:hypothetical protein AAFF_G00376270 [Aldrovandia affinis]